MHYIPMWLDVNTLLSLENTLLLLVGTRSNLDSGTFSKLGLRIGGLRLIE